MSNNAKRILPRLPVVSGLAALAFLLFVPDTAQAQVLSACYVPNSGVVYRVNTTAGENTDLKDACTGKKHILFSWNAVGPAGADGADGEDGADGQQGLQGVQGLQGEQGPKGDTGDTGAAGADGADGPDGEDGDDGQQGLQGVQGATGAQGPIGLPGPGRIVEVRSVRGGTCFMAATGILSLRCAAVIECPPGFIVTGGGGDVQDAASFAIIQASHQSPRNAATGWRVDFVNPPFAGATSGEAFAICLRLST